MRPIKLTMEGFGSYGEKTEIDFTKPKQNLFLVTGETGSGKSTIFDAVTYALYGEASSNDNKKNGAELQSQYINPGKKEPFVELTFSENGKEYVIRRTIPYINSRGSKKSSSVELKEQGTVVCGGTKEVNARLVDILGLSKDQFTQVSMLAQGEFMDILRDSTKSKKEVFRHLFRTEVFDKLVTELGTREKKISQDIDRIFKECRSSAAGVSLPDDYEGAYDIRSAIDEMKSAEELNITHLETLLKGLDDVCAYLRSSAEESAKSFEAISERRTAAQKELNTAEALLSSFEALENAERELKEYASQESDMQAKKSLSETLTAAYEIGGCFELYDSSCRKLSDTEQNLKTLQAELPSLKEKAKNAAQIEVQAKEELDKQNEVFVKVKERVSQSLEIFKKIDEKRKQAEDLCEKLAELEENAKKAAEKLSGLEEMEKHWKASFEEYSHAPVELGDCKYKMEGLDKLCSGLADLRGLFGECRDSEQKAKSALEQFQAVQSECRDKEREYEEMQNAYLESQAGFLAREKLRPGCKCPVCGSLEHPEPCVLPENYSDLTRESIEELGREVEKYRGNREKAAAKSEAASTSKKEKQSQYDKAYGEFINGLKSAFISAPDELSLEKAEEILTEKKNKLQSELKQAEKDAAKFYELQKNLRSVDDDKQKLKKQKEDAEDEAAYTRTRLTAAETEYKTLEQQKSFSSEEEAQSAFGDAEQSRSSAQEVWESAAAELEKAKSAEDKASTLIEKYQTEIPGLRAELSKREEEYRASIARLGLAEDEWKALTAEHRKEEIRELRESFTEFDKAKANAAGAAEAARKAIGEQPRPDIEALRERASEADRALREANDHLNSLKISLAADTQILNDLNSKAGERARIVKEHDLVLSLFRRLSGKNSGEHMDIETYVQRYYLDRILAAANNRFRDMSTGEYELRMTDIEEAGQSKNRGLDLMVYSYVTGMEREVRTLSGGESFMAALALSLGMADVIQAKSAAVRSEIMFIDEGFGALSDAFRRRAVRVLQEMAEGSHLIGIISHVSELKSEIDDQLIVTKDENGSHVGWRLS